jgi:hypothetical protein
VRDGLGVRDAMTVDHPQFGLMCEICFTGLTESDCVVDTDGQRWDLCRATAPDKRGSPKRSAG